MATSPSRLAGPLVGLAAFLFFWVQPLAARLLLPSLGGSSAVWNACMVFFQAALLVGYAAAHFAHGARFATWGSVLLVAACSQLLLGPPRVLSSAGLTVAALAPIASLALAMVFPLVVLAMASPLVQRWRASAGSSPWSLYAWSNLGSLAALLAFPLLLEPQLSLSVQYRAWSFGVLMALAVGVVLYRSTRATRDRASPSRTEAPTEAAPSAAAPIARNVLIGWALRSALASSLLLSVTAHLTTDIAAVPLLWVLPLSIYLAAFAWSFAPGLEGAGAESAARTAGLLVLPLVSWMGAQPRTPDAPWLPILGHLVVFAFLIRALSAQLVASRPEPARLTVFYGVIAAGGLAGSLLNTFLCPVLFNDILEYPVGLIAAAAVLGAPTPRGSARSRVLDVALPLGVGALLLWLGDHLLFTSPEAPAMRGLVVVGPPTLLVAFFFPRRRRYLLGLLVLFLASGVYQDGLRQTLFKDRGAYGAFRVQEEAEGRFRILVHGNTIHGRQAVDVPEARVPLAYYHPTGPVGDAWRAASSRDTSGPVAVIGLGIGSMAAHAEPGRRIDFFELDPKMKALATDTRWFRYLADCSGRVRIILGDARLSLERPPVSAPVARGSEDAPESAYALIVVDAFSSDGIPVHLLTREALAVYLSRLAPGGLLAFHISNRYLDLVGPLRDLAADASLIAVHRADRAEEEQYPGKLSSEWIVLARQPSEVEPLLATPGWRVLVATRPRPWTDDFADIVSIFNW